MRKILVTGGAGFIGSHMVKSLVRDPDNHVTILDNLCNGSIDKLPDYKQYRNWKFIACDVNEYKELAPVFLGQQFDYIFHFAALVGVDQTLTQPMQVLQDLKGIEHLLNLAKDVGVKRMIFASSSEVYGESHIFPQHEETTPLNARLPYAVVKSCGEVYHKVYQREFGLDYTIFRFFNMYGPFQRPYFVVSKFIKAAIQNKDIYVYGDGSQSRTFCLVHDGIEALAKAYEAESTRNQIINVGNDEEISVLELAHLILDRMNSTSKIVHLPPLVEGDMARRLPDLGRMRQILGRELTSFEEGIDLMIRHIHGIGAKI